MDEVDGIPESVAFQSGHVDALKDAPVYRLRLPHPTQFIRPIRRANFCVSKENMHENVPGK